MHRRQFLGTGVSLVAMSAGCAMLDSHQIWSTDLDPAGAPAVSGDTVYVGTETAVHALAAQTGEVRWTYEETDAEVREAPTVIDGTVFVGSYSGAVHAIRDGEKRWVFDESTDRAGTPVVVGSKVYVEADQHLYVLDRESGQKRRQIELTGFDPSTPSIRGGSAYLVNNGEVWGIDLVTGDARWHHPAGVSTDVTCSEGIVYTADTEAGRLTALDGVDGSVWWQADTGEISTPVIQSGRIYASEPQGTGIWAYTLDGRRRWITHISADTHDEGLLTPAVDGGRIFALNVMGERLFVFDAATGEQKWWEFVEAPRSAPAATDGHVFVPTSYGIRAYRE